MTTLPSEEQQQREAWDQFLLDIETRTEQLRQLKTYEGKRLVLQGITAGAAIFAAGVALMKLLG